MTAAQVTYAHHGDVLRVAIYTRVSQDKSGEAKSPRQQENEIRKDVERIGGVVVDVYSDNDRSASSYAKKGRPEFARLLADLATRRFDVIAVWESSRLTRDQLVSAQLATLCREFGVSLCINGKLHDPNDPGDKFMFAIDAAKNAYDSDQTSERVKRDVRDAAERGMPHGKRQFGYERVYDGRRLMGQRPHDVEGPLVTEMYRRVYQGDSLNSVCRWLAENGHTQRNGKPYSGRRVREILLSPQYLGHRTLHGDVIVANAWEALVSEDMWHAVRMMLTDETRRTTTRQGAVVHLMSGILDCGKCGEGLYVKKSSGNSREPFYVCRNGCCSRRVAQVDEAIRELIVGELSQPRWSPAYVRDVDDQLQRAEREAETLRNRIADIEDAFAEGEVTAATMGRALGKLQPRLGDAERRIVELKQPISLDVRALIGRDAAARWDDASLERKRNALRSLLVLTVNPQRPGHRLLDGRLNITAQWVGDETQYDL